jgi:uncharacterized hydrophobic protein (TIGR00271 family)
MGPWRASDALSPNLSEYLSMIDELRNRWSYFVRRVGRLRGSAAATVPHGEVMAHVRDGGDLTPRFALMTVLSCGIAILGLLQNSVAVIIGAMLVSPLMGPIVALGFSLTTVDYRQMKRSVLALAVGLALSLVISIVIVSVSPLQAETPEILARTNPNLFDLLVAVFSGLAGGYAVIKRKGEAIVGVAIATALMPPLAVVGYGVATLKMQIALGSFLLFMTNLLAIALSVALLARWYRFTASDSPVNLMWQTVLTLVTFAALSVPLGLALVDIGRKTVTNVAVRSEIEREFDGRRSSIERLSIAGGREIPLDVVATVLTPEFRDDAESAIAARIGEKLRVDARVTLDQVVISRQDLDERFATQAAETALLRTDLEPLAKAYKARQEALDAVTAAVFFPVRTMDVDPEARRIRVEPNASASVSLRALRQLETSLHARFPDWDIAVIPVVAQLPSLYFESGHENFLIGQHETVDDIIWALKAWQVTAVTAHGFASSSGSVTANRLLAERRAAWVAESLRAAGFDARAAADFRVPDQRDLERRFGLTYFQRVDIQLGHGPQPAPVPRASQ